jgi:hypothetical protein
MQTPRRVFRFSLWLGLASAAAVLSPGGDALAAPAAKAPCIATPTTIKGQAAIVFCGPATAVLHVGGKTYDFVHGYCSDNSKNQLELQLSLGASVPSISNSSNFGQPYLTIALNRKPVEGGVSAWRNGKALVVGQSITFHGSLPMKGTFVGKPGTKPAFNGSWNCHGVLWDQSGH